MEIARIEIDGVTGRITHRNFIPAGLVGGYISVEYSDPRWKKVTKTVVFKGAVTKDVVTNDRTIVIPSEVVAYPGKRLYVGFYGTASDGTLAIPTLWVDMGVILPAADPSGDESTDPSLPVYAQLAQRLDYLENTGTGGVTEYHSGNNLYDPDNLVGTMVINGSTISSLSNWIPVKAKTKYVSSAFYTQFYFFDTEKNYLGGSTILDNPAVLTATQDGFLLINTRGKTDVIVVEGTTLSNHYEDYYALREGLTRRVSKADNNSWIGKKWLAIGDSLTDPGVADKGYPYLVSKALGMTLTNVGVSGKVMNYFIDLIPDYADDFDLVTVLLGTNNQGYNCAVGSLNDGADYTTNNSFYAQTQKLAEVLMAKYPAAVIAFMTPIRRCDYGDNPQNNDEGYYINALGLTTEPYAEAVKEVADYYGLPCLDLYHNGINPKSEWMRKLYFVNADGTHPNNDGHAKYTAPVIKAFLESLAPFGERIVVEPDIPEPDEPGTDAPVTTYTVTNMLTNAANSNSTDSVAHGASYSATITANDGYELDSVTVTMGGTDISASAVNGGVIDIASVTGNIVITSVATETEVDNSEPVLVHSYLGTSAPESGILEDQTGSYDLSVSSINNRRFIRSNTNGLGIANGDSVSFKFVNVKRGTVYFSERCEMDTGGLNEWHYNVNGNTDLSGRFGICAVSAPEGNTSAFGDSVPIVFYANAASGIQTNKTTLYGTTKFAKDSTFTVAITYNSADKSVKMYVNGALEIDEVMSVPMQIEGLALHLGCSFERFEVYKGIISDVQ